MLTSTFLHDTMKFNPGQTVITHAALQTLDLEDYLRALKRHVTDWGDVSSDDRAENEWSLQNGFHLLSV